MVQVSIEGKYVLVKSENFDDYLKACGVNFVLRAIANKFKPLLEIFREDEYYVFKSDTPLKTICVRFQIGEEYEMDFPDGSGRKMVALAALQGNGNVIKTVQKLGGCTIVDVKEFSEEGLVTTLTHSDGIVCVRTYKRVQ